MKNYEPKKILVPVDLSEVSEGVIRAAAEVAKRWNAELLVVHVAQENDHLPVVPDASYRAFSLTRAEIALPTRAQQLENVQLELESRLEVLVHPLADGLKVRTEVLWGSPLKQIVQTAETEDADLIVMATHGRAGLSRFFLGSVTESVLRRASCPVLAIRAKAARERLAAAS